ncbi:MAG: hypothetical protein GEU90_20340 [Gemmatimonas sp.]|nr:hypothetical protein [Gemmatimonas sp.]
MYRTFGSRVLLAALLVVAGFAVAGLLGYIHPVTGAAVGLGSQVVGTVAFFMTYILRAKD